MRQVFLLMIISATISSCIKNRHDARRVSSSVNNAESVYLTRDNFDNPVILWTEKSANDLTLVFAVSYDDGNSFSQNVSVALDRDIATHAEGMPKIAFKKDGTIIVAYEKKAPTKENKYAGSICYITSKDQGKSWSRERYMHSDTVAGRSRSYFDIEALADGEVGASWLDIKLNQETDGRSVVFAKTNEADFFIRETLIDSSACQCCRIDLYTDIDDNVFVAYRGLRKSIMGKSVRDMMVATSTDEGTTFTSPLTISADNWNIDGCPHTGPSLCSNKAGLVTLWYTEGNGNGIYYAHKSNSQEEFLPRQLVSTTGRHPQVSSNNDRIAMLWEENSDYNGKQITTVNYRVIEDGNDVEKSTLTPKDANAFLPVVTQTKNGFLVAYLTMTGSKVGVYFTKL
ncbi:MAG TPA: sialidase family protein [Chryseolinea sp.]|nr:sialidase family protein [Chryseolinea sp.]